DASADEWCERRLLARIHHYTVKRLRAEIEPVAARDFLRFLLAWQHVSADARMEGAQALDTLIGQIEGFEAPAAAWESEILTPRRRGFPRAGPGGGGPAGPTAGPGRRRRPTGAGGGGGRGPPPPTTLIARRNVGFWTAVSTKAGAGEPSRDAQAVLDHIG